MARLLMMAGAVLSLLTGCSLAPAVNRDALAYFKANDLATNQVILLNILLAKDRAPLHFSELADIHGSLSVSVTSATALPFGPVSQPPGLQAGTETPGFTITSAPTFDINSLDTEDFINGIMTPISPETAAFFLNEGLDPRMVLMLLAQGILVPNQDEMFLNAPDSTRHACFTSPGSVPLRISTTGPSGCDKAKDESEYFGFLNTLDHIGAVYPVAVSLPGKDVGKPIRLDSLRDIKMAAAIDPSKFRLRQITTGPNRDLYQFARPPQGAIILCGEANAEPGMYDMPPSQPGVVEGLLTDDDPSPLTVPKNSCDPAADPSATSVNIGVDPRTFIIKLRSTAELVTYIGRVLALQDRLTQNDGVAQCITLQIQYRLPPYRDTCAPGGALFDLQTKPGRNPSGLNVTYQGRTWYVPAAAPDDTSIQPTATSYDHSLETMAIISLLLNQNKSAKDISKTANVQLVP